MEYRILGPFEVLDDGATVDVGPPQQRALLAFLLTNIDRVVATDRILEELWPDEPRGKENTLWVYVSRLRSILEPGRDAHAKSSVLATRDHGYVLLGDSADVDARRFEEQAAEGSRLLDSDPEAAAEVLGEALALWRGGALEDFAYEDFARADAARLEDLRLTATEDRIDADLRLGRHRTVAGELERLIHLHPHRERLVSLQMLALYRSGRQADALRAFERHRTRIGEELGIEPSRELRRVEEQVLLHDERLAPPPTGSEVADIAPNPFKGLQAFTEADAATFFGRDQLIADLVGRVETGSRLLALVGASGSGKSSVLHAGLVPAIRAGSIYGSAAWPIVRMVPGRHPFREAEAAFHRAGPDGSDDLPHTFDASDDGLLRAAAGLLPDTSGRVLIVIDQFEELFTLGASSDERDRFVQNLLVALDDPHGRVVVAIGLRADFYGHPLEYPGLARMLGEAIVNVVSLTPDELESAAVGPAAWAGAQLEPALMVQLLGDVAGQAGGLPVFQHALRELYESRDGPLLTLEAYHAMGGVRGAIAKRAEYLFSGLGPDEQATARQLFLRLVTIVEQGAWSRRRVAASELVTIDADLIALQTVLDRFGAHRLLTFDRDLVTGSPSVEVAHEALLNEWPRLRAWIDIGQKDVLRRGRLSAAMAEWEASGRKIDYLLSGQRLADYESWAAVSTLRLTTDEARYLDESIEKRESVLEEEAKRLARERKRDRQATTRLWGLAVGAVVVVAAAIGAVFVLAGDPEQPSIAVVHGVGGDRGVADLMIAGAGAAERGLDLEVDLVEPLVDPETDLRRLGESGADLVVVGSEFDAHVERVAPDFPDTHWVAIDPVALHIEAANISEIHFAVEDSAFLAGAAAALSTGTRKVGFIGGLQLLSTERSRNGFEQGVAWEDPGVEVASAFIGPVENPLAGARTRDDLAHDLAEAMYGVGVDVIFHDAGEAGSGVLRAAREATDRGQIVWTIGSDADEYLTATAGDRDLVLTSTVKRIDQAVETAIEAFLDSSLEPGNSTLGLGQGGVALSRSGDHLTAVDGRLRNLEGDIEFGHLFVSPYATRGPDWQAEADVTIHLTVTSTSCEIDRIEGATLEEGRVRVGRGEVVQFHLDNRSNEIGSLAVHMVPVSVSVARLVREAETGLPPSLGPLLGLTFAELGGQTNAAVVMTGSPIAPNCSFGGRGLPEAELSTPAADFFPLIVSPA